ncbi:MAG TPA: hypothetical protein VFI13_10890 [Gemmatimonadales bacterium]|nr:hypothetical protein [Gemmatimonadales bacterium]
MTTWSIDSCAREAKCVKGLVIHYFRTREALLAESAGALIAERALRWSAALNTPGVDALDRLWDELARAATDGSGRALLELRFAGTAGAGFTLAQATDLVERLARALDTPRDELPAPAALGPILEGYILALMESADPEGVKEAFFRYWLTYVK